MLDNLRKYIYDRRRGIFTTTAVMGTLYFAGNYVLQRLEEVKDAVVQTRAAKEKYICSFAIFPVNVLTLLL